MPVGHCVERRTSRAFLRRPDGGGTVGIPSLCVERRTSRAFLRVFRHLLSFLSRLVKCSRHDRPRGSLPAFACDDVATTIPSITEGPSLFPPSFTRSLIGAPCGCLP